MSTPVKDRCVMPVTLATQESGEIKIEKELEKSCAIIKREILKKCEKIGEDVLFAKITKLHWNSMRRCFQNKRGAARYVVVQNQEGLGV